MCFKFKGRPTQDINSKQNFFSISFPAFKKKKKVFSIHLGYADVGILQSY